MKMQDYKKVFAWLALSLGAQSSLADKVFFEQENKHKPIIELSGTKSKKRNLGEVDLMLPIWQKENDLIMLDSKFKRDCKSFEYNLGLVYRHNFHDKWILGIYNYFDHRKTALNLRANQWTFGAEFLSRYLDGRANFYIPENKQRTLHTKPIEFRREHTTIYAVSASKSQEHTLPGYDLELGTPLFGLFPKMDDKFGAKIYLAKYDFTRKSVAKNARFRFRLEQKLFEDKLAETGFTITLNLGTHYTNKKKLDNFVGLSLRMPLSNYHPRRSKMQERMMDTVIRDVDIRTEKHISESKEDLFWNGKKVSQMYFVTDGDLPRGGGSDSYIGDGSPENPFSIEQYRALINRSPNPDFIIIPIGEFTAESFAEVRSHSTVVDRRIEDVVLAANNGSTIFKIVDIPFLQVEEDREEAIIDMMYNYDDGLDTRTFNELCHG